MITCINLDFSESIDYIFHFKNIEIEINENAISILLSKSLDNQDFQMAFELLKKGEIKTIGIDFLTFTHIEFFSSSLYVEIFQEEEKENEPIDLNL